jgi:hypothetical protein
MTIGTHTSTERKPIMSDSAPTLGPIRRHAGVAGQLSYSVSVTYAGEPAELVTFVGSTYGGPVVLVSGQGTQLFVTDAERFGPFGPAWVRAFFGHAG